MKHLGRVIKYIIPYKSKAILSILFNLFSVFASLFSVMTIIPFLEILFGLEPKVISVQQFEFTVVSIKEHFYYNLSHIIEDEGKTAALFFVSFVIITATLFRTGLRYFAVFFLAYVRNNIIKDIRDRIYNKILRLPLSYYSGERKGDIMSRMTNDVQEIERSIISSLEMFLRDPITIVIYVITLFIMSTELTVFIFILLPLSGFILGRVGKSLKKKSLKAQNKLGYIISVIDETISGLRIIKAFNAESKMNKKFRNDNSIYTRIMIKLVRRQSLANPLSEFLGTIVMVVIMMYGSYLVLNNKSDLQPQDLISYLLIFYLIIVPAKSFSTAYYNVQKGLASEDRVNAMIEAKNKIEDTENAISISEFNDSIEFRNTTFRYEEEIVLNDINLKIKKGQSVALVGQSGSGKSTLVDLLPRFYDIEKGSILIDNKPITDYKILDLRNLMGNVNQASILFNDTIFNNIAFGVDNANDTDVIAAAKVANAHEFIINTPNGYQTNIGDQGGKLSGGQRQRISIARAVLKNPPILILDEATSALDTESERLVQDALINLMKNRTSIVIAHRLSTVQYADIIYVLQDGKIVEQGNHQELTKFEGVYKKFLSLQMVS